MNDDTLNTCALRFDGYKYLQRTGFDPSKAIDNYFSSQKWDLQPLEKLTAFFLLQRALNKWDLVNEPRDGQFWKAFESLFNECKEMEIPEEYRQQEYCNKWEMYQRSRL
ncbi:hypothetical protein [Calothrix sp. NIES-2098]|uniref:hypothetical protein n=1 Tax=Calothrix sp. NIES-2098 TaxID=1954171 RepID=UPI000B5F1B37|nr:hypothetical protein NIES2098_73520 [Calothrix sp. NIES-2098]